MDGNSTENRIYQALADLLRNHGENGSVVLVEEPESEKFVQFGYRGSLEMDVPHVALANEEADRAYAFYSKLGNDYLKEYHAPDPRTGKVRHGATFNYDFGQDARAAAMAGAAFFRDVYLFPPEAKLSIEKL